MTTFTFVSDGSNQYETNEVIASDTIYVRNGQTGVVGTSTKPSGYLDTNWQEPNTNNGGTNAKALMLSAGSSQIQLSCSPIVSGGKLGVAQYLSPTLPVQTISSGNWTIAFGGRYGTAGGPLTWNGVASLYLVNGSSGSIRTTIFQSQTIGSTSRTSSAELTCYSTTISGAGFTTTSEDYLVLELGINAQGPLFPAGTVDVYADGTTAITTDAASTSSAQSVIISPTSINYNSSGSISRAGLTLYQSAIANLNVITNFSHVASGGLNISNANIIAKPHYRYVNSSVTGNVKLNNNESIARQQHVVIATNGMVLGNTTFAQLKINYSAIGNVNVNGTAIVSFGQTNFNYSASGNVILNNATNFSILHVYTSENGIKLNVQSETNIKNNYIADIDMSLVGITDAKQIYVYNNFDGKLTINSTSSASIKKTFVTIGGMQLNGTADYSTTSTELVFAYSAIGSIFLTGESIFAIGGKCVLSGTVTTQIFINVDMPTGGMNLKSTSTTAGRYFNYEANGEINLTGLANRSLIEKAEYFLSIENKLIQDRQNRCLESISKNAISGYLTGTKTKILLDQADDWEVNCINSPNQGDVSILVYKDKKITKITCNIFSPNYIKTIPVPIPLTSRIDLNQYRVEINYSGDDPIIVKEDPPIKTPNVAILPAIRIEKQMPKPIANVISQSHLLSMLGEFHFLRKLSKSDWKVLDFKNNVATIKLKDKNTITVSV